MRERLNGVNAFQELLIGEVRRLRSGLGDSNFRQSPFSDEVLSGARSYLGGDEELSDAEVVVRAGNQVLTESGLGNFSVQVRSVVTTVYKADGNSEESRGVHAELLHRKQDLA